MQFRILGPVEVLDDDGVSVPLGPPRQHALLAALLVHLGEPMPVERLIGLLWGEAAPPSAPTIVHGSVAGLRRALEAVGSRGRVLVRQASGYALGVPANDVDALRFEQLVDEGRRQVRDDPEQASALLARALSSWHGPPLAGVNAPFAAGAVHRLEELRLEAVEARAEADLALGRHTDLVSELEAIVSEHPLRERPWALLMVALYRCGRQSDALAAYQSVRRILDEQLGVLPGPELEALQHAVLQHHPSLDPPGATPARSTLPRPLGEFVGRRREIAELAELLEVHRLVSVVGAAGVGKSRLAVEVAHSVTGRYPAGVWFVELATLTTAELVPQAVADALGVRSEPGVRLTDTITAALARRRALLILDNCEHLLPACRILARTLVTAGAELRVVATSRQSLGIGGEAILALSPLPVPEPDDPWEKAATSEAVWLFGTRAASAQPGFRVTEANVGLVRDICTRLDGLPLAIELAAGRTATLPLRHIADRLDHQHRILDARDPAPPDRHGGLDTAVKWSYDLLNAPEQLLFERVSVFSGGFVLDDAEAVAGDPRLPAGSVAAHLSALVSSSLVQLEHISAESGRYRMLGPLRQYAQGRLADRGDATTSAKRHARHYLALIEEAEPHFYRAGSLPWIDRIRTEHENMRAALQWAFGPAGDGRLGAHMAALLWHPWDLAGARTEGLLWIDAGLRVTSEPERRLQLLAAATLLRLGLGEITTACEHATEQLELARAHGHQRWQGDALTRLGMIAWTRSDLPTAALHLRQAADALRAAGDEWRKSFALAHLARVLRDARQLDEAEAAGEAALATARQVGEDTALGFALDVLASVLHRRGRTGPAGELVEQALAHYRRIGYQEGEASALQSTGRLSSDRGDLDASRQAFRAALKLCLRLGHRAGTAASLEGLASALIAGGDDAHAAVVYGAATQHALLDPVTPGGGLEEIRIRLSTNLNADQLQRAIRQGADTDLENLAT